MFQAAILALLTAVLIAAPADAVTESTDINVLVSDGPQGIRVLEGRFVSSATLSVAREVLADYANLASFVSSVQSSVVLKSEGDMFLVEQVMKGKVGPFRKKIFLTLEVFQTPTSIAFRDVRGYSFTFYEGSWGLIERGEQVEVVYELKAKPAFFSPEFITGNAFKNTVRQLLTEVRDEIVARQANGSLKTEKEPPQP